MKRLSIILMLLLISVQLGAAWTGNVSVHINVISLTENTQDSHKGSSHTGTELTIRYPAEPQESNNSNISDLPEQTFQAAPENDTEEIPEVGIVESENSKLWLIWPLFLVLGIAGMYWWYRSRKEE